MVQKNNLHHNGHYHILHIFFPVAGMDDSKTGIFAWHNVAHGQRYWNTKTAGREGWWSKEKEEEIMPNFSKTIIEFKHSTNNIKELVFFINLEIGILKEIGIIKKGEGIVEAIIELLRPWMGVLLYRQQPARIVGDIIVISFEAATNMLVFIFGQTYLNYVIYLFFPVDIGVIYLNNQVNVI
ncbi:hypothetical protein ACJX0J_021317, partial [Zea mays]